MENTQIRVVFIIRALARSQGLYLKSYFLKLHFLKYHSILSN